MGDSSPRIPTDPATSQVTRGGSGLIGARAIAWTRAAILALAAACGATTELTPLPATNANARVASVSVAPVTLTLSGAAVVSAVVRDSSGFILLGRPVVWTSLDTLVATVSGTGVLNARLPGRTSITATSEGITGSSTVVVPPPVSVASIVVRPDTVAVEAGQLWPLSALLLDSAGHTTTAQAIAWSTSDSAIAVVSPSGVVIARSAGTVTISATAGGKNGRANVRVFPTLPVGALTLTPDTSTAQVGGSAYFTLAVTDIQGNRVLNRPVSWSTSNGSNAQVISQGQFDAVVSALSPGTVFVMASSGGRRGSATLCVVPPPTVAQLSVSPVAASLPVRRSIVLAASAQDGSGASIFPPVTWRSSDSTRATVGPYGTVTALAPGAVTITATAGSRSAQSTITATAAIAQTLVTVAAGQDNTCGLSDTGAAFCWGQSFFGARGDGSAPDTLTHPVPARVSGNTAFASISAGDFHVCAVSTAGVGYCWGSNARGQLGAGSASPTCPRFGGSGPCNTVPLQVAGNVSMRKIAAGGSSTCAVTTSSTAYCWGDNATGHLGTGTTASSDTPVPVSGGMTFTSVSVGRSHACALTPAGKAFCWGSNSAGQTGAPTRTTCSDAAARTAGCSTTPQAVARGLTFISIAAGGDHSCALTADGSAFCWGSNVSGELGDGSETLSDSPVAVAGGLHFTSLSAGDGHTCGITAGATYCWGSNTAGQLGAGLTAARSMIPVLVLGGLTFEGISAGSRHSCGIAARVAYCWGSFVLGQLGTGDTRPSPVPKVPVTSP